MKPLHKKGDVLQINMEGTITSCIIVSELISRHTVVTGDCAIMYYTDLLFNEWPRENDLLTKKSHTIENLVLDVGRYLGNCYELLVGDQKVFLAYKSNRVGTISSHIACY